MKILGDWRRNVSKPGASHVLRDDLDIYSDRQRAHVPACVAVCGADANRRRRHDVLLVDDHRHRLMRGPRAGRRSVRRLRRPHRTHVHDLRWLQEPQSRQDRSRDGTRRLERRHQHPPRSLGACRLGRTRFYFIFQGTMIILTFTLKIGRNYNKK